MKITIIELLNKIANKEDLPKKIRYNGLEWKKGNAENEEKDYLNNYDIELFNQYIEHTLIESLKDEVEIERIIKPIYNFKAKN